MPLIKVSPVALLHYIAVDTTPFRTPVVMDETVINKQ